MNDNKSFPEIEDLENKLDQLESESDELFSSENTLTTFKLNSGDSETYQKATSEIFSSPSCVAKETSVEATVQNPIFKNFSTAINTTKRLDFSFDIKEIEVRKKVLTDTVTGDHVSADISNIGPRGSRFTWNSIANLILLIVGYAFPMHRLQRLLGHKLFRIPNMVKQLDNLARNLAPVYLYQIKTLANSRIIEGDDSPVRVNEVTSYKRKLKQAKENQQEEVVPKPWEVRINARKEKNKELLKKDPGAQIKPPFLMEILQEVLGFEFSKVLKKKKKAIPPEATETKISLFTSVASGLEDELDPQSRIVIYRSHFGSFGNLLEIFLKFRKIEFKDLIILSDLSFSNYPKIAAGSPFTIQYAGCSAHARRPFKRYHDQAPELCEFMLASFERLALDEKMLDCFERNTANTTEVRKNFSMNTWNTMLIMINAAVTVWSKQTPIGQALRYIKNNFNKLVFYCSEPRLSETNNRSENLLRYEALEDNSSFGRDTLEGRARYDIIRSELATCSYAGTNPREYFTFILIADKFAIDKHPELYTPQSFVRLCKLKDNNNPSHVTLAKSFALRAISISNRNHSAGRG